MNGSDWDIKRSMKITRFRIDTGAGQARAVIGAMRMIQGEWIKKQP